MRVISLFLVSSLQGAVFASNDTNATTTAAATTAADANATTAAATTAAASGNSTATTTAMSGNSTATTTAAAGNGTAATTAASSGNGTVATTMAATTAAGTTAAASGTTAAASGTTAAAASGTTAAAAGNTTAAASSGNSGATTMAASSATTATATQAASGATTASGNTTEAPVTDAPPAVKKMAVEVKATMPVSTALTSNTTLFTKFQTKLIDPMGAAMCASMSKVPNCSVDKDKVDANGNVVPKTKQNTQETITFTITATAGSRRRASAARRLSDTSYEFKTDAEIEMPPAVFAEAQTEWDTAVSSTAGKATITNAVTSQLTTTISTIAASDPELMSVVSSNMTASIVVAEPVAAVDATPSTTTTTSNAITATVSGFGLLLAAVLF